MADKAYRDALVLMGTPTMINNKGLTVDSLVKLFKYKAFLKHTVEDYYELQKELMASFEVEEKDGQYSLENNPKKEEIVKAIEKLKDSKVEFPELNFLSPKEFLASTDGYPIDSLATVAEYLLAK